MAEKEEKKEVVDDKWNFGTPTEGVTPEATTTTATIEAVAEPEEKKKSADSPAVTNAEAPVKRSPGRPRKSTGTPVTNVETTEKPKVGRPRKSAEVVTNVEVKEVKKEEQTADPRITFIQACLKKAGQPQLPPIESLFTGRENAIQMEISDIAVFIDEPADPLLHMLADEWKLRNNVNLSTEVSLKGAQEVGIDILKAGHVFMGIEVAKIKGEKTVQCWSGRHRLIFLALAYGINSKIPVSITEFDDLATAREAAIFANKARRTLALEKAEFRILKATGGDSDMKREEMYVKAVTKKSAVPDFAVFSVVDAHTYGTKLAFKIATDLTRSTGLTTVNNLKGFWKKALTWDSSMSIKDFDEKLRDSCTFLNTLVEHMEKNKTFNNNQHLASRPLVAIGTMYQALVAAGKDASKCAKALGDAIIDMGDIGSQKSDTTYNKLQKTFSKEINK